ncbi:MAG: hypothetical protein MR904_03470 [Clostridia bacterium]|nr:hypothetical protein [Clostridia bacterium]
MRKIFIALLIPLLCLTSIGVFGVMSLDEEKFVSAYSNNWSSSTLCPSVDEGGTILVKSGRNLAYISANLSKYSDAKIVLTGDIDLAGYNWIPIGNYDTYFSGTFDGQDYSIINMYLPYGATALSGLFGYVKGATITNVKFDNCEISSYKYCGLVAGVSANCSISEVIIHNSSVKGQFSVDFGCNELFVGGVCGSDSGSYIRNCYVNSSNIYGYSGNSGYNRKVCVYAGGVCGSKFYNTITLCYSADDVYLSSLIPNTDSSFISNSHFGGIVGSANEVSINKSYSMANIKNVGTQYTFTTTPYVCSGGIIGYSTACGISNCFNRGNVYSSASKNTLDSYTVSTATCGKGESVKYANNVNKFFGKGYDLYIATGDAVFNGYSGKYATKQFYNTYQMEACYSYAGGIAGETNDTTVFNCYNTGDIDTNSFTKYTATIYSKWVGTRRKSKNCNLLIKTVIEYPKTYGTGNIVGYIGNNCEYNNNYFEKIITKTIEKPTIKQSYEVENKSIKKTAKYEEWGDTSWFSDKKSAWYLKNGNWRDYFTYFDVNASNVENIHLMAYYHHNNKDKGSHTRYFTLKTGVDYTKGDNCFILDKQGIVGITAQNLDSQVWDSAEYINDGKPYIRDMYW